MEYAIGDSTEAQSKLVIFWDQARTEIDSIKTDQNSFKSQDLPLARIKKIMKLDEDVKSMMISAEAPVLFAKAAELFIREITLRAWIHTERNKRRTLQRNDITMAVSDGDTDQFDFLIDIVPREEVKAQTRREPQQPAQQPAAQQPVQQTVLNTGGLQLAGGHQVVTTTAAPQAVTQQQQQQQQQQQPIQYVLQLPISGGGQMGSQPIQIQLLPQQYQENRDNEASTWHPPTSGGTADGQGTAAGQGGAGMQVIQLMPQTTMAEHSAGVNNQPTFQMQQVTQQQQVSGQQQILLHPGATGAVDGTQQLLQGGASIKLDESHVTDNGQVNSIAGQPQQQMFTFSAGMGGQQMILQSVPSTQVGQVPSDTSGLITSTATMQQQGDS